MDELADIDEDDPDMAAAYRRTIRERFNQMERERAKRQNELDTHNAARNTTGADAELLESGCTGAPTSTGRGCASPPPWNATGPAPGT